MILELYRLSVHDYGLEGVRLLLCIALQLLLSDSVLFDFSIIYSGWISDKNVLK